MKMKRKKISFSVFPSNEAPVEWKWQGKTEELGEKPVPVPLCPPQILRGLTRDRTRASAVRGRRLNVALKNKSQSFELFELRISFNEYLEMDFLSHVIL
jgi:hypothetical protein